ncbi:hypothetical protein D3C80_1109860 [compost metagenome]
MHDAVDVTQAHGTDGQPLHRAQVPAHIHVVVDGQRVFDDDEQPGDQVGHQRLRAKADGQADHTGTGQQRGDVHAHVGQGDDHRNDEDHHEQHVADQRHHGLCAGVGQAPARAHQGVVHGGVGKDPHQPGDDQRAGQAQQAHAYVVAVAFGEADHRQAPHAQPQLDEHQPDEQVHQQVAEVAQAFGIHRLALVGALGVGRVAAHQAVEHHAHHHQHRAHQRLAQGGAGVAGRDEGGEQRDGHQDKRRDEPEAAEDLDGVAEGAPGQAP